MKGLNTLVISDEQMKEIVQEWWRGITYNHKTDDVVTDVSSATVNNVSVFEIQLEEPADEKTGGTVGDCSP